MTNLGEAGTQRILAERVRRLRPDLPARWGRMSAHGMICHLNDSFLGVFGERHISAATGLLQRTAMKWFALWVPLAWPKGLKTRPEVAQECSGTPPADFEQDRERLLQLLERFATAPPGEQGVHPIFGRMSRAEWLRWGYLHTDHHLRQFGV